MPKMFLCKERVLTIFSKRPKVVKPKSVIRLLRANKAIF